ncbi:MAG: hypothetical protein ACOY4L_01520 [Pseudomonadota bacterium]
MRNPEECHILLGRLDSLEALAPILAKPLPEGLAPQQIHILSGELPSEIDAAQWRGGQTHPSSPKRWVLGGALAFLPIGLAGVLLGNHWLWLPGMLVSGAVWGWFAHFYWRLFRTSRSHELQDFGLPKKDWGLAEAELADGAVILVLTLRPTQVDIAERWLSANEIPAYHVLV